MGSSNSVSKAARIVAAVSTAGLSEVGGRNSAYNQVTGRTKMKKMQKQSNQQAINSENKAKEAERQKAIANESVRLQKERARRRTIFAGSGQNNIFSPTLGGTTRNSNLG